MNYEILDAKARSRKQLKYGTRNLTARFYGKLGEEDEQRGRRVFDTKIRGYEAALKARARSLETIRCYEHGILAFGGWLVEQGHDPNMLWNFDIINEEQILAAYRTYLLNRFESKASAMQRICALNSWLKWLSKQLGNAGKEVHSITVPSIDAPDIFVLSPQEMLLMQQAAKDGKLKNEENALLWLLIDSWQRITAIVSLRLRDIDFEKKTMTFRASTEKTRRNLVLTIQYEETIDALYRQISETNPGRDPNGFILCAARIAFGPSRSFVKYPILTSHIKRDRACEIVRSIARKSKCAKSTVRYLTPHCFRRFAVTECMIAGILPSEIMTRSGHRDLATLLERYARPEPRSELLSRATYLLGDEKVDEKVIVSREAPAQGVSQTSMDLAEAIEAILRKQRSSQ